MCEPTSIAVGSALISGGAAVASHVSQGKQKKANDKSAQDSLRLSQYDLGLRQQEESRSFRQQIGQVRRQGRSASSAAAVSAAEAGVGGRSVDMMLDSFERDESLAVQALEDQAVVTIDQLQRAKTGQGVLAANRMNAVAGPSTVGTGLAVGSAGLDLFSRLRLRNGGLS